MTVPFNADVCAAAIVAAARAYGDHPVKVMAAQRGKLRRSLAAAVAGIVQPTGKSPAVVCRVIGISIQTYHIAERDRRYHAALRGAEAAIAEATGTDVPAPRAPAVAPLAIDHRGAIKDALDRRQSKGLTLSVAGVERDKAALARAGAGGCRAQQHLKDIDAPCDEPVVLGRLFCAPHCRALGQKDTPVTLAPALMPTPFGEREARS